jgi:hypothetical protein
MTTPTQYRDTEIAALKNIAKLCEKHGMEISWEGNHEFTGKCWNRVTVTSSIRPARECDGIWLTVRSPQGNRVLDGQDYMFMHESCSGYQQLDIYLSATYGEMLVG